MLDAETEVNNYLESKENEANRNIVMKTKEFLSGFYSTFGLELLSTVDYIMAEKKTDSIEEITKYLESWSNRKKTLFSNPKFITLAVQNIQQNLL